MAIVVKMDMGRESGDDDQVSGGAGAVQMPNHSRGGDRVHDQVYVGAHPFCQPVDDGVKQSGFTHQAEIRNGKHKQHRGIEYASCAGSHKLGNLFQIASSDERGNEGESNERDRRGNIALEQNKYKGKQQEQTNNRQLHRRKLLLSF